MIDSKCVKEKAVECYGDDPHSFGGQRDGYYYYGYIQASKDMARTINKFKETKTTGDMQAMFDLAS